MAHTLAAVFESRVEAELARDKLLGAGFDNECIRLNESASRRADASDTGVTARSSDSDTGDRDTGFMDNVRDFFSDLFGHGSEAHSVYSEAVTRGNVVLTVQSKTQDEIERAADIVEACGPVDIDEQQTQWRGSGWAAPVAGASASQSGASMQSAQSNFQSGDSGSRQSMAGGSVQRSSGDMSRAIPVIEEELKIGKRNVERGGVRVFQRMVETPVSEDVSLREEHVKVERTKVDRPVDPSELKAFQETSFELRESAEEAVVQKTARVVEEVRVGKEQTERKEHISDTLRHTEVEVEKLGADDDELYRSHWQTNFASSGRSYDEYAPAYRYGYSMAGDDRYRGRSWDESEATLRSDWESRYPGSTWENFKAAVRHGWNRLMH